MQHIFFIHSSVDGYLGCFQILAAVSAAALTIGVFIYANTPTPTQEQDCLIKWQFQFLRTSVLFSITVVPMSITIGGFFFLHTLSSIYCLQLFDDAHSDGCEVITHCSFDLHFSNRLPRWCSGKESSCQCRRCKFDPWVRKIPWSRKYQLCILAWKIPGTEEPSRLQSMGLQRVRHNLVSMHTHTHTHTHTHNILC